jgi:hypothetical protein
MVARWGKETAAKYRVTLSPRNDLKVVDVLPAEPGLGPEPGRENGGVGSAIFVRGAFIALPDQTVQSVYVYVNREAAHDFAGCSAAAQRILATLAPGSRKLLTRPGERWLGTLSPGKVVSVSVPQNTVATRQVGPDFLLERLIILGRLGAEVESIGLYFGRHPSFKAGEKASDGTLFGKKVAWQPLRRGGLEALVALPEAGAPTPAAQPGDGDQPMSAHVWITAANAARLAALKRVAESMTLIDTPKAKPRSAVKK